MDSPRLAFIGLGNMNGAILRGILASGFDTSRVVGTVRNTEKSQALASELGVTVLSENSNPSANQDAVQDADIVFLGVKPFGIAEMCEHLKDHLKEGSVVVSVAAAITTETMEKHLNPGQSVIRTMPNVPLQVGKGAVGLSAGTNASESHVKAATELFEPSGIVVRVPEEQLDAVSAISGSGPAYAFYLAELIAEAGEKLGLAPELSRELARATVAGAGLMLDDPAANPVELRKSVTSPNGTTEVALRIFAERGLGDIIAEGAAGATARAQEISKDLAS
ncbi:pyrroline-5-carboxylate reductase [Neomicrococcus aestuarii]|uniref:Pyrroline-5-carboxylate reductase n=1 Tax=Neomicrococcus aestuarii TaxID=556325 RepID=A0A7W8TV34_9MICC|nr:pyrroline-5-carboxylate reductase [Neomicrococcus aestuarii]MBB5513338.1 pyrroline-5-carboxylate reductase [Neomicrococcus aestuarii]